MEVLKKRNEFKLASSGKKFVTPSFILLQHNLEDKMHSNPKIGYTASKRIGTSVRRNKAKRRMRSAIADVFIDYAKPDTNYVMIARKAILDYPFETLKSDLENLCKKI
tara:strand:+ start:559 stop:882 length:324 start_codon:yes stop_codon:yes gene_type:complete